MTFEASLTALKCFSLDSSGSLLLLDSVVGDRSACSFAGVARVSATGAGRSVFVGDGAGLFDDGAGSGRAGAGLGGVSVRTGSEVAVDVVSSTRTI